MRRIGAGIAVLVGLVAVAFAAAPAGADIIGGCPDRQMSRPFLRWLDPVSYTLAPDGGFEHDGAGWQLRGGADVIAGNESFALSGAGGSSLYLPSGSSATSPQMCVETLDVFARYVAKNRGTILLSSLKVDAIVRDGEGHNFTLPAGVNTGGSSWQPSLPAVALLSLLGIVNDGNVTVSFRFTPVGLGAKWQIDDLYVDPLKMG
jgi:hypothetical protein